MNDSELRRQAIKRLEEKRDFRQHLVIYLLVNAGLCLIWYITNSGGYFWPIWPMFAWGIGIVGHAYQTYGSKPIGEEDIQREMANLGPTRDENPTPTTDRAEGSAAARVQ